MRLLSIFLFFIIFLSCSSERVEEAEPIDNPYYDMAYHYLDEGRADSAFLNFSKAKDRFVDAKDSLNIANCLIIMAIIQKDQGDYFGAQETALGAIAFLDESNPGHYMYVSTNYNNLGATASLLGDKRRAISFYESALLYSKDTVNINSYLNNLGRAYHDEKEYAKAIAIYKGVLQNEKRGALDYARTRTNYATAMWQSSAGYNPVPDFFEALAIRKERNEYWGQNSSYAHLAAYYATVNTDSSLYYSRKQYAIAKQINSVSDQINVLKKLVALTPEPESKYYFGLYNVLNDSLQNARATAKNQFALIRYEVEKNKADNLQLQKDNAVKANHLTRQRATTGGVSLVLLVAIFGGRFYYNKRKQQLELEAQNQIKASKLKTSRKVHDVVANGIYRIMTEIEYKDTIDRDAILDKLEVMYNKSRDISYETEEPEKVEDPYNVRLMELMKSFATERCRVRIAGNDTDFWDVIDKPTKAEIRQVLQELMVNMNKHSQATDVVVRFEKKAAHLYIYYIDDGIGIDKETPHGNGLTNMVTRIESLGGHLTFVNEITQGLRLTIAIPLL